MAGKLVHSSRVALPLPTAALIMEAVMTDAELKALDARLSRVESALAQQQVSAIPGGPVVDPAPWPGGGGSWPYWAWPWPFPNPVVDPATFMLRRPGMGPIVDPAANQFRTGVAQEALGRIGSTGGDPPPIDVSRLSMAQLEAALHSINAEKSRLTAMETLVSQQIQKMKTQG